jgi:hypothetical protein
MQVSCNLHGLAHLFNGPPEVLVPLYEALLVFLCLDSLFSNCHLHSGGCRSDKFGEMAIQPSLSHYNDAFVLHYSV